MQSEVIIQGRPIGSEELALIRAWLQGHPEWNRTRLSRELCLRWGWRNAVGRLKDMACRTLLLKLEARGQIHLPPRQTASVNGLRHRHCPDLPQDTSLLHGELAIVVPLQVQPLLAGDPALGLFQCLLQRYHYVGLHHRVGQNLAYLARDRTGRPLACVWFGSAAWHVQARDQGIGWTGEQQQRRLHLVTNHTRFLILPWVRGPQLGSHLLGGITARLAADGERHYGHPLYLVETFVDPLRFAGTCDRAAGWLHVGTTTGRGRNEPDGQPQGPPKDLYLKALRADTLRRLTA